MDCVVRKTEASFVGRDSMRTRDSWCVILVAVGLVGAQSAGCGDAREGATVASLAAAAKPSGTTVVPAACSDSKLAHQYAIGTSKGQKTVDQLWRKSRSCGQLEAFADQVWQEVQAIQMLDDGEERAMKLCRHSGTIEGALDQLDTIETSCDQLCFFDGEERGKLTGKLYCDLMIETGGGVVAADWIRGPVGECGLNYEGGCDSAFLGVSTAYTNAAGSCAPYSNGAFLMTWNNSRSKSCDYNSTAS
jgi:hypothetical protein